MGFSGFTQSRNRQSAKNVKKSTIKISGEKLTA